jgi:hypothetical protein
MTDKSREEFEARCRVLAVKHYRYAQSETALRTLFERRTDGAYAIDWVDGAWIGWQAAMEAEPVISIDPPDLSGLEDRIKAMAEKVRLQVEPRHFVVQMPDAHSYTVPDVAGAAILDCMTAIQKAGGKAKL